MPSRSLVLPWCPLAKDTYKTLGMENIKPYGARSCTDLGDWKQRQHEESLADITGTLVSFCVIFLRLVVILRRRRLAACILGHE